MSQRICEVLTPTFTFLVGILPSSTLRTFRAEPVKKNHPVVPSRCHCVASYVTVVCAMSYDTLWSCFRCHINNREIGIYRCSKISWLSNSNCWRLKRRRIVEGLLKSKTFIMCSTSAFSTLELLSESVFFAQSLTWVIFSRFNAMASELRRNNFQLNTQLKTIDAAK